MINGNAYMPLDADDLMKIQGLLTPFISRNEYDPRHSEIEKQIARNEENIQQLIQVARSERDRINTAFAAQTDKTNLKVDEVSKQCDDIKQQIRDLETKWLTRQQESSITTIRYIVSVLVSFVIGVIMFALGQAIHLFH